MKALRERKARTAPPSRHPRPTSPFEVEQATVPQAEEPAPVIVEEPAATPEPPAAAEPRHVGDTSSTGQIAVYITTDAVTTARAIRRPGVTNAHIALRAVEDMHGKLKELVATRRAGESREVLPGSSLFPSRSGTAAGTRNVRRVLWAVRLTPAEVAVVDDLARAAGAASRSELVSVAVEAYLDQQR